MSRMMRIPGKDLEIASSVIILYTIKMVNDFPLEERSRVRSGEVWYGSGMG